MEHLTKLLRDSYDLQESKPDESAYWHLQQLRSEIKQLTIPVVVGQSEQLLAYTKFLRDQLHLNISDTWVESYVKNSK